MNMITHRFFFFLVGKEGQRQLRLGYVISGGRGKATCVNHTKVIRKIK